MIPLLEDKGKLKKFLEYCELAVRETGKTLNERGPMQQEHFRKIKLPALRHENTPVVVLLSEIAWTDIELWDSRPQGDQIIGMKCCRSRYSKLFDTFNGNDLTSTTLWSFSGPSTLGNNLKQGIEIPNKPASFPSWDRQWQQLSVDISNILGITKRTLTYN